MIHFSDILSNKTQNIIHKALLLTAMPADLSAILTANYPIIPLKAYES